MITNLETVGDVSVSPVAEASPARTALYAAHAALGASFTDFGGWEMPLKYGSELAEHRAVREAAGLFDLSHMGEVWVEGSEAATALNQSLVGDLAAVAIGKAKYSLVCAEDGGIIDDVICYRVAEDRYLVVPNAGNASVVARALTERAAGLDATVRDDSATTSLIAVQGPRSAQIVRELLDASGCATLDELPYYASVTLLVAGHETLVARTGYTGEDGFELFVPNAQAAPLWQRLLQAGAPFGLIPAGLACRDSLRLEAGMPLYGHELTREVTPLQAGLGGVVSFTKAEDFPGRAALEAERAVGPQRVLVGLVGQGRRAGRDGYAVVAQGTEIGRVTSGQPSPTLGTPIALAFVTPEHATPGTAVEIDLRGKCEPFTVVTRPFYRRAS